MDCKKCKVKCLEPITLRKNDHYCETCFIINLNHKFRACIGKNRLLSTKNNVLLCLSGGLASLSLLNLVYEGVSLNNHKLLRVNPMCVHVTGLGNVHEDKIAKEVIDQCKQYGFDLYVANACEYDTPAWELPIKNCIQKTSEETQAYFNVKLSKMTKTSANDFIEKLKRRIFISVAQILDCSIIFTAETTTTLASNLLSNLAIGRGSQIEDAVGFCDSRDENVKIIRPMKDISQEELYFYSKIKNIIIIYNKEETNKSLQNLIKSFVVDLQENFQSTISTVCKTADKIGLNENNATKQCIFCQSHINHTQKSKLTAHEATIYSRALSNNCQNELIYETREDNQAYCYSCSKNIFVQDE